MAAGLLAEEVDRLSRGAYGETTGDRAVRPVPETSPSHPFRDVRRGPRHPRSGPEHCRTALDLFGVFGAEAWKSQADFKNLDTARQAISKREPSNCSSSGHGWSSARATRGPRPSAPPVIAGRSRLWRGSRRSTRTFPPWPSGWPTAGKRSATQRQPPRPAPSRVASPHLRHGLLPAGRVPRAARPAGRGLGQLLAGLARQPDHYLSLLAAGVALGELKGYESAEAMLTGAIAMNPQTRLAYAKRGQAGWSRARSSWPRPTSTRRQNSIRNCPCPNSSGDYQSENLELDKALADYSEAIRLDPKSALAYAEQSHVLLAPRAIWTRPSPTATRPFNSIPNTAWVTRNACRCLYFQRPSGQSLGRQQRGHPTGPELRLGLSNAGHTLQS